MEIALIFNYRPISCVYRANGPFLILKCIPPSEGGSLYIKDRLFFSPVSFPQNSRSGNECVNTGQAVHRDSSSS